MNLQSGFDDLNSQVADLTKIVSGLNATGGYKEEGVDVTIQKKIEDIDAAVKRQQTSMSSLSSTVSGMQHKCQDTNAKFSEQQSQIADVSTNFLSFASKTQTQMSELHTRLHVFESHVSDIKCNKKRPDALRPLVKRIDNLSYVVNSQRDTLNDLQKQVLAINLESLEKEIDELTNVVDNQQEALKNCNQTIVNNAALTMNLVTELSKTEQLDVKNLQAQITDLSSNQHNVGSSSISTISIYILIHTNSFHRSKIIN